MASRFEMEVSGQLGEYWQKRANEQMEKVRNSITTGEAVIDSDGAIYWACNGSYWMKDLVEVAIHAGIQFSPEATTKKREEETATFLTQYRKKNKNRVLSHEERAEMTNAFGKGATVVDVFTGQTFKL